MPKAKKQQLKVEIIVHKDRRFWVRKNGRLIYESPLENTKIGVTGTGALHLPDGLVASLYRKLGVKAVEAATLLNQALLSHIPITHPCFVRPYESTTIRRISRLVSSVAPYRGEIPGEE